MHSKTACKLETLLVYYGLLHDTVCWFEFRIVIQLQLDPFHNLILKFLVALTTHIMSVISVLPWGC